MNKYSKIIAVVFCFVLFNLNIFADEMYTFVTNVNAAWASTNYSQLLQLINDRLSQNTNDILALGTKQWYYFECDLNISNAHSAANALRNAAQQTGREDIIPIAENITRIILDIPVTVTGSYTQAQIELQHNRGGEDIFVGTVEPLFLARQLEKPATNYPTLTVDSMPTNGIYINVSNTDRLARGSTNTPYVRVYFPNQEITVTAPPSFGTNTFLRWSSDGTNTLGTTTNITVSITNNIKTIAVYGNN